MPGRTYPSFGTAFVAILGGAALASWFFDHLVVEPYLGREGWTIVASIAGALAVKVVLRSVGYDVTLLAAGGAVLAQRTLALALVGVMPSAAGPALPFLPYGLFPGLPCLVLGALVVQLTAGRPHHATP